MVIIISIVKKIARTVMKTKSDRRQSTNSQATRVVAAQADIDRVGANAHVVLVFRVDTARHITKDQESLVLPHEMNILIEAWLKSVKEYITGLFRFCILSEESIALLYDKLSMRYCRS